MGVQILPCVAIDQGGRIEHADGQPSDNNAKFAQETAAADHHTAARLLLSHPDDVQSGCDGPMGRGAMAHVDERVAYLEGRMEDHTALMGDIRVEMRDLRSEMRDLRSEVRSEMKDLRAEMDRRFDRVDQKFTWLVGILVGVLLAIVGLAFQVARLQPS
ncbi:MAG: hypothetical protein ACRD3C_11945 [Vicinamibacterales bacterium]